MNRHYTTEDYLRRCGILREIFDHPAITTDVIAGFPGETEEEFEETRRFLENLGFVTGAVVTVVSTISGNMIVNVKDSRIAVNQDMAKKIMV